MQLTHENYHSIEANNEYMSVSTLKNFLPMYAGCQAAALAKLRGEYEEPESEALLMGSYVHSWNQGTIEQFKAEHPEMYSSKGPTAGQLKSSFLKCNDMIDTLAKDEFSMKVLNGQKEVIMTAEMFNTKWKIMIDSYSPEFRAFADLKTTKDIYAKYWNPHNQRYENFFQFYGYDLQMAIYAEVERIAHGREPGDFYIPHLVVVDKTDPPNHDAIFFDGEIIKDMLDTVEGFMPEILALKRGEFEPRRCEKCPYCRSTKRLTKARYYREFDLY